jgi:alanyl-tRNA synthetase
VLVLSTAGGKVTLVLTVTRTINGRLKAGDLIRPIAQLVGGNGGGRPDMAQAGGPDVGKASEALAALYERVGATLGTAATAG